MVPSSITAQAAHARHAEFRRVAARAAAAASATAPGERGRASARFRSLPRWSVTWLRTA
jgi:hypothetical protein